ncbi:MAG: hypothetical protein WDN03_01140 [Rhizomicrobium sp.]
MRLFFVSLVLFFLCVAPPVAEAAPANPDSKVTAAGNAVAAKDAAKALADSKAKAAAAEADRELRLEEALLGVLVVAATIGIFAWRTEVLRDSDPVDFPGITVAGKVYARISVKRTFSLAQSQMVWWFWIVLSSTVYIAIFHRQIGGGLNAQALTLMGIGAGTAIGAAIIEQSRTAKGGSLTAYDTAARDIATATGTAEADALYVKMQTEAEAMKSDGFIRDILSDADGISLHRFQAVAWSAVLGATYLLNVAFPQGAQFTQYGVVLPLLSTYQLGLLGISAGTYLGLKIPEKQVAETPAGS